MLILYTPAPSFAVFGFCSHISPHPLVSKPSNPAKLTCNPSSFSSTQLQCQGGLSHSFSPADTQIVFVLISFYLKGKKSAFMPCFTSHMPAVARARPPCGSPMCTVGTHVLQPSFEERALAASWIRSRGGKTGTITGRKHPQTPLPSRPLCLSRFVYSLPPSR